MPPNLHELKVWPEYFVTVQTRPFEVRKNDRDFKLADHLVLKEWDPKKKEFTGRQVERLVTHIFDGTEYLGDDGGAVIRAGYVILGVSPVPFGQSMLLDERPSHVKEAA